MNERVRVLIADDQRSTRRGLKALLALAPQIEVIAEAANGQEAVQLTAKCHPDVVLMDMQMPVLDGVQATRLIKRQWPEIKVIALTIYPTHKTEALKAGVDAFLLKGGPVEVLQTAILESSDLRRTVTSQNESLRSVGCPGRDDFGDDVDGTGT